MTSEADGDHGWFASTTESPFINSARDLAPTLLGALVPETATWAVGGFGDGLLVVEVPDVPTGENPVINNSIQVMWDRATLGGYWGCAHLFDDFDSKDDESLFVDAGVSGHDDAASTALAWIAAQLRRPLHVETWRKGDQVVAERWVLVDTGREIGQRGSRWAMRRGPSKVSRLRPGT